MKFGISIKPDGDFCANCNYKVSEKENFCPNCGVPLNQKALDLREEEYKATKIETISEIEKRLKSEPISIILKEMKKHL